MLRFIPQKDGKVDNSVVLSRALNTLLLCHMYIRADCTWDYILAHCGDHYNSYDIRVLLACVEKEAEREQDLNVIAKMITIVTLALSGFKQREKTNVNAIKIQKKHNATNRLKLIKYK